MDAATRFDTQIVGSLPIITEYLDQLGLADAVNSAVPWEGDVPLGDLLESHPLQPEEERGRS